MPIFLKKDSLNPDSTAQPFEFNTLTFYLTEDCNYACSYCYQKKGKRSLKPKTLQKAIDFFSPYFGDAPHINFYGGEPLLAFNSIEQVLKYLQNRVHPERPVTYSITTNGSLISREILSILDEFRFRILLSFDGYSQDVTRKNHSFRSIVKTMRTFARILT